ncbi:MAG TPA: MerR family transcriptional regulator [Frankiaceae bacterium]|nr:MerR family transcriptional regulator [Frankiaceae bacterium]
MPAFENPADGHQPSSHQASSHQPSLVPEVDVPGGASRTIGEVLAQLRPAFPELTISKIRFYEAQGLLTPQRTASGYRKFSGDDVARLRYILTAARDHYLPLKVIRAQLEALDRGETPAAAAQQGLAVAEDEPGDEDGASAEQLADVPAELRPEAFDAAASELRLSRGELMRASGLSADQLAQLEQFGLVAVRHGSSYFDGDSLVIAKIVAQISRYGLEARHLRPVKAAADREVGLVEQVVSPMSRQRAPGARAQAAASARELASLSVRLHAALVSAGLRSALRG